ncbi:MAG: T9SS type A sorting domain-containing protein [Bacteroidia bacterium]|nr:T9SS type A sorting domain-containing protein [Bacteroidia bacterium]MCF8447764.1 T9SS type A sorting domain-containing protein [Bacteroidia bacterium]
MAFTKEVPISRDLGFVKNSGQILDQNRKQNANVLYLLNQRNIKVHLTPQGFNYEVTEIKFGKEIKSIQSNRTKSTEKEIHITSHRIEIEFVGSNQNMEIIEGYELPSKLNFYNEYTPTKGFENIPHFGRIIYKNIYPKIDIEFIESPTFKYNIILHPGANLSNLKFRIKGAINLFINEGNEIEIQTSLGKITEKIPLSYFIDTELGQTKTDVFFKLIDENTFGFDCKEFSSQNELVIDPSPWATYFGGSAYENGNSIKIDSSGNSFISGYTYSTSGIATAGAFQTTYSGNNDGFIIKVGLDGQLIWATYYGGSDNDYCYDLEITKQGFIVISGSTGSNAGISTTGSFKPYLSGYTDAFLAKFNSNGTRIWASYFGGNVDDYGNGIASDQYDNIYIFGYSSSDSGIATIGAHQNTFAGGHDCILAKFNSSGDLFWATYLGGNQNEFGNGIKTDIYGSVFVTGFTSSSSGIASTGTYQSYLTGSGFTYDAFLVKFNADGLRVWGTYFGGEGNEDGRAIAIGQLGEIYWVGSTKSSSNISTFGAHQQYYAGDNDAYLAAFDSTGNRKWSTYYGGLQNDYGSAVVLDEFGNICMLGFSESSYGISSPQAFKTTISGDKDIFISKFDTSGFRIWGSYYGGNFEDYGNGIAIGKNNYILVTGITNSTSGFATSGVYQPYLGGTDDAFILSLTGNGNLIPINSNSISANQKICNGGTPSLVQGSNPLGGSGTYAYSWLISYLSGNSGFFIAPGINNQINYLPAGNQSSYWLKRLVTSGGDYDSSNFIYVEVNPNPDKDFGVNSQSQCANSNNFIFEDFSTETDSIISRIWRFGDGLSQQGFSSQMIKNYPLEGNYNVKLIRENAYGCKDSVFNMVFVNTVPIAEFVANGFTTFCFGDSLELKTIPLIGTKVQWLYVNQNSKDTLNSLWAKNSGSYRVAQLNSYGCSDTSPIINLIVNPKPNATIIGNSQSIFCTGDSIEFISANPSSTNFYQWQKGNNNLFGANSSNLIIKETGNFRLWIRNEFGCFDTSETIHLNFNPKPLKPIISGNILPDIKNNPYTYTINHKTDSVYKWIIKGLSVFTSSDSFAQISWVTSDKFVIQVIDINKFSCASDTGSLEVNVTNLNGINEINDLGIKVFPNPTSDIITILNPKNQINSICIIDILGRKIIQQPVDLEEIILKVSDLKQGNYLLQMELKSGISITRKIIIQ